MLPLVQDALRQADADVPHDGSEPLRARLDEIAIAGLHHLETTARVTGTLLQHGIMAVPFKGPTLALLLYGSVAMRSSTDVDLLVSPSRALAARRILERQGFRFWAKFTSAEESRFLRYANE